MTPSNSHWERYRCLRRTLMSFSCLRRLLVGFSHHQTQQKAKKTPNIKEKKKEEKLFISFCSDVTLSAAVYHPANCFFLILQMTIKI